jgi:hypothetical protein
MPFGPAYPGVYHQKAAEKFAAFFCNRPGVDAILLVNSCARGQASPDSCLDLAVILTPEAFKQAGAVFENDWEIYYRGEPVFAELEKSGLYSNIEPHFCDGTFSPTYHGWTSGPDGFELEIGNLLAYSFPLWQGSHRLDDLKKEWLPYYSESLRSERLEKVRKFCLNNLNHIEPFAQRGLYFQCFNRFYDAYREFLQALFIAQRVYPIAYDKWICEQIVEILGMPYLYEMLPHLFEIQRFESLEIVEKAQILRNLVDKYTTLDSLF